MERLKFVTVTSAVFGSLAEDLRTLNAMRKSVISITSVDSVR